MKKVLALISALVLLIGSAASAQSNLSLTQNSNIPVSFYSGNPSEGGSEVSSTFDVYLSDTSIGKKLYVDANYIVLDINGTELIFDTWGVTSTTNTYLRDVNDGESITLGQVVNDIYAAASGEKELAIFTDSDGVVTGFYSFYPDVEPNTNVSGATYLL